MSYSQPVLTDAAKLTFQEWQAQERRAWQESGTGLSFEDWQQNDFAARQAEQDRARDQEMATEQQTLRMASLLKRTPPRYARSDTDHPDLIAWAHQLRELDAARSRDQAYRGPSLLISGATGTGKTHGAFAALRRYVSAGGERRVTAIPCADLYAALRPRSGHDSEAAYASFATAAVLFVDDLGAAKSSDWTDEITYRLINHRYNHELATLITTNIPPQSLGTELGERISSRLAQMCRVVVLKGDDRRRKSTTNPRSEA